MSTFSKVATIQGHIAYTLFSVYAVNPDLFIRGIDADPGAFLFYNMMYGVGVHIYTRPSMTRITPCYRTLLSIYGSFMFNSSSMLIFIGLRESYGEKKLFVSLLSFLVGKFLYSMFYTYLYFVDTSIDPTSRRHSALDYIFSDQAL